MQGKRGSQQDQKREKEQINGKELAGVRGKMAADWVVIQTGNQCDSSAGQSGKR